MFGRIHFNCATRLAGAIVLGAVFLAGPVHAESVPLTIANIDNRTVTVTAYDMNAGGSKIFSGVTLKHNEQETKSMVLDKDNNGHVKFEATAVDVKGCEKRTYEGKQLSRGFSWQVSLKCS